ncbi:related to Mating factor alpha-1 [Saccharomycodes ludwigii]|uniref:Related to Mating factor alpha-1 n=1 Tax=Saccharomycodes ludwigii TaxID=36035 RepID=A0A376B1X9_9ASCO|nr:related to Mating factor alpha-1 [Saccharomycodes ludwigii]
MRFCTFLSATLYAVSSIAFAAPINETGTKDTDLMIPQEAVLGILDLSEDKDIGLVPISNGTFSGILFVNTTIAEIASKETSSVTRKRSAIADAWQWLTFQWGEPMYKKRDAEPEADAWQWLTFQWGEPMYKKRDAEAEAWQWLSFQWGEPMYKKREAEAEADAWQWLTFQWGEPMY